MQGVEEESRPLRNAPTEQELRVLFDKFDFNNDNIVDIDEICMMIGMSNAERNLLEILWQKVNQTSTRCLNFAEFQNIVQQEYHPTIIGFVNIGFKHYVKSVLPPPAPRRTAIGDLQDDCKKQCFFFPYFILMMTIIQVLIFVIDMLLTKTTVTNGPISSVLFFDPKQREQLWRYLTYMFVHLNKSHLVTNMVFQMLYGVPLETQHHGLRISVIYICGVIFGSLATTVTDPHVKLCGASGGVYALLTAHIATVLLNWNYMRPLSIMMQLSSVLCFFAYDFLSAIYYRYMLDVTLQNAYAGHIAGASAGLLVGVTVLRRYSANNLETMERRVELIGGVVYLFLLAGGIIWNAYYISVG